mgnify:CR=1 FL=1
MNNAITPPVKVGVVGCGTVAQIIHLPVLSKLETVEVTAICDIDARKTSILANRYNIANVFDDIEEMFDKCELDAALILTPNNMHLPMSLIALKKGAHIFIEKPAGRTYHETNRIAQAAQQYKREVMVGMHSRFRGDIRAIKKYLVRKELGEVFFVKAEWLQTVSHSIRQPWLLSRKIAGGGVLLDLGIQLIDTGWWLTNRPQLLSVKANVRQINTDLEVEDFCSFYLKFSNNIDMVGHVSWNFPIKDDRFFAEIFGSNGIGALNPFKVEKHSKGKTLDITPPGYRKRARNIFKMAYENEIIHFIDYLTGKAERLESAISDQLEVLKITDAIYESIKTNRDVSLANGA